VEDKLDRPRTNLRKVNLDLALLAGQAYCAVAALAKHGAVDLNRLIDPRGTRAGSSVAVLLAGLAPRPFGLALRLTFRERSRLALATPPQLLDEFLQLLNLATLLGQPPPELRVLLKEFLVSLHRYRELQHTSGGRTSFRSAYPSMPARRPAARAGKAVNRYVAACRRETVRGVKN